jgi:hypothetical protein
MSAILCTEPVLLTIYRGGPNVGALGGAGLHRELRHEVVQEKKNVSVPASGAGVHAQRVCACIGTAVHAQRVCAYIGTAVHAQRVCACSGAGVHAQRVCACIGTAVHAQRVCACPESLCLLWCRVTQCVCSEVMHMCTVVFCASEFCICSDVGVNSCACSVVQGFTVSSCLKCGAVVY